MHLSLEMLSLPSLVFGNFFFCLHRAVFEADFFYINSFYDSISGVLLICVSVPMKILFPKFPCCAEFSKVIEWQLSEKSRFYHKYIPT